MLNTHRHARFAAAACPHDVFEGCNMNALHNVERRSARDDQKITHTFVLNTSNNALIL